MGVQEGTWQTINAQDLLPDQNMEYAGWKSQDDARSYPNVYDGEKDIGMRGCLATRVAFANGEPRAEVEATKPDEMAWILNFKYYHAYEVSSGWKRWESNTAEKFIEGADGFSFPLFVECSGYCEREEASATAIRAVAAGFVMLVFSF